MYNSVITSAGANKPGFDYIDSQTDVGGYPDSSTFKGGTAPKDTDQDGMPDAWETEHGLNPNDDSDGAIVLLSADDYTNLEMYLNELAGDPVEYNGNITRDPITGKLIKSIEVLDTAYYSSWAIDTSLETGNRVFGYIQLRCKNRV